MQAVEVVTDFVQDIFSKQKAQDLLPCTQKTEDPGGQGPHLSCPPRYH